MNSVVKPSLTSGALAFLEGRSDVLTSADIDPANTEAFGRYERAMSLKASGDLAGAAALLELSCLPPSIYKGHYRELFKIWRHSNRAALAKADYKAVVTRVLRMVEMDDELIEAMLGHWSTVQERSLPADYFDSDRNLLVSDAKALCKAATACQDEEAVARAKALLARYRADA